MTDKTIVVFREYADGEIIALFPEEIGNARSKYCMTYVHLGQHGVGDIKHILQRTYPATNYQELENELANNVCYSLDVRSEVTEKMHKKRIDAIRDMKMSRYD